MQTVEMRRFRALIELEPDNARARVRELYRKHNGYFREVMSALGCSSLSTWYRWVRRLGIEAELEQIKTELKKSGKYAPNKGGRPAVASSADKE